MGSYRFEQQIKNKETNNYIDKRHNNTKTSEILITESILMNILYKYLDNLNNSKAWIAPLGVFLSTLVTILTSTFKDTGIINKDVWLAIFVIICATSLALSIIAYMKANKSKKECTIEYLVGKIKNKSEKE